MWEFLGILLVAVMLGLFFASVITANQQNREEKERNQAKQAFNDAIKAVKEKYNVNKTIIGPVESFVLMVSEDVELLFVIKDGQTDTIRLKDIKDISVYQFPKDSISDTANDEESDEWRLDSDFEIKPGDDIGKHNTDEDDDYISGVNVFLSMRNDNPMVILPVYTTEMYKGKGHTYEEEQRIAHEAVEKAEKLQSYLGDVCARVGMNVNYK